MGVIFEFPPSTYLNNPMVVTSVVTYTFSIGSFVVSPWSRYGPSVDWGVQYRFTFHILTHHGIAEEGMVLATNEPRHFELEVVE